MTGQYRILNYVADPFSGTRFPIAVLVLGRDGKLAIVLSPHTPGAGCLGSAKSASAIRLAISDIKRLESFDELPRSFGPQFMLSSVQVLVSDQPEAWVRKAIFPTDSSNEQTRYRDPNRGTIGKSYFRRHGVTLKERFLPEHSMLNPITHYIANQRETILMEPIAPRTASGKALSDLRNAYTGLRAMHDAIGADRSVSYYAYLLSGIDSAVKSAAQEMRMSGSVVTIIDTENRAQEQAFLETIKSVSGELLH